MGDFRKLKVWNEAKDLAIRIYQLSQIGDFSKDFGLRDQLRRSAVSIPSNIAEGDELQTNKQSINYFYHAKASTAELYTQLIIAFEIGYLNQSMFDELVDKCDKISAMLSKLIVARKK